MTAIDIADLWRWLDDTPDDLGRLLVIADAYRDEGMDAWADCLEWCYRNESGPSWYCNYGGFWGWVGCWGDYDKNRLPSIFDCLIGSNGTMRDEYFRGHSMPSLAYQFLCRMWDEIGGVKEDV